MAKSFETRFTEYVKTCKSNLKTNLINKGQTVTASDTLDALVSRVANITPPPAPTPIPFGYTRDTNLPDFDAMFDADTDRKANGGDYDCCIYVVCYLYPYSSTENQQSMYVYGQSAYPVKVVFGKSDRELSITSTSQYNFTVNSDELYTLTDGSQVYLMKMYSNRQGEIPYSTGFNYLFVLEEIREDSSYRCNGKKQVTQYHRAVLPTWYTGNQGRFGGYDGTIYRSDATFRVDGGLFSRDFYFIASQYPCKIIVNGDLLIYYPSMSATTWGYVTLEAYTYKTPISNFFIPALSQSSSCYGRTYVTWNYPMAYSSQSEPTVGLVCAQDMSITVPESYQLISAHTNRGMMTMSEFHIPSTIDPNPNGISSSSIYPYFHSAGLSYFYNLRNLKVSPGAYGLNTSALTLYFEYCSQLTTESLANLVDNLADRTGMVANTIRFSNYHKSKLTDAQITTLQNKNWTVTFVAQYS